MPEKKTEEYGADNLVTLDPIAHIQKRPSLTLGPFDRMQLVALREPVDNALDEHRAGHGKVVKITLHSDGAASVEDAGRGVPTDKNSRTGENGIYMAFGKVGSGGKFGAADSGYAKTASLGLNGVGTTATNATSLRFDTIVYKGDGTIHRLSFKDGKPGRWDGDTGPSDKFTPGMDIWKEKDTRSAAEKKERPTGTTIKFWPNPAIFGNESSFRVEELRDTLRATAFLMPGVKIIIDDKTAGNEQYDEYEFDGGLTEMVEAYAPDKSITPVPVHIKTSGHFQETVPVPQADGTIKAEEVDRLVEVEVAFRWGTGYEANVRSYVNTLYTPLGGTHVQGFQRAISKVFLDHIKNTRGLLKAKEEPPILDDIQEGLTAIISVNQSEPSFVGQDKQRLGGTETGKIVSATLTKELKAWTANKKNAAALKLMATKIVEASRIRLQARQQKEVARKKSALETATSMPSKLVECAEPGTPMTELHIAEGDSALGTMKAARDSSKQALFPIRGKILNVHKSSVKQMLDNAECAAMIQIIGAGSGKNFDLEAMRYQNICLAVDADVDGAHIRSLLITFFYTYMRPMVEAGRLFATQPPLYVLKTTGKNAQIHYLGSDQERDRLLAKLDKAGTKYEPLQRLKGLGEMDAQEFWDTTLNPETRTLRRVTIREAEAAEAMLELAMGNKVEPRRDWIMASRAKLSENDLDV